MTTMPGPPFLTTTYGDDYSLEPPFVSPVVTPGRNMRAYAASGLSAEVKTAIALNSLEALQQIALKGAAKKDERHTEWAMPSPALTPVLKTASSYGDLDTSYAAPLSPLRARDGQALSTFFDRADMDSIEADVLNLLSYLFPEPCWEDDPFEFLREFL